MGDGTLRDDVSGLIWSKAVFEASKWDEANDACVKNQVGLNGEGWRLPTVMELTGIVDYSRPDCPMWSPKLGAECPSEKELWSSTMCLKCGWENEWFFTVYVSTGIVKEEHYGFWPNFRCVRGPIPQGPESRFTVTGDGTIADGVTGLLWQPGADCGGCDWKKALAHCQAKGEGWRLPDVKELMSVMAFEADNCPMWNPVFGNKCPDEKKYWTGTAVASDAAQAYYGDVFYGNIDDQAVTQKAEALCVRKGK
jgi:hypothetical protein